MTKITDVALCFVSIATLADPARAAACYRYEIQPATLSCAENRGNSADFGTQCTVQPAKVARVPIACPKVAEPASSRGISGSGASYGDNCACDHKSDGGWH